MMLMMDKQAVMMDKVMMMMMDTQMMMVDMVMMMMADMQVHLVRRRRRCLVQNCVGVGGHSTLPTLRNFPTQVTST